MMISRLRFEKRLSGMHRVASAVTRLLLSGDSMQGEGVTEIPVSAAFCAAQLMSIFPAKVRQAI
ncbi:MAG: hypothetical protein SOR65_10200 [Odoribacter sp.]|nr:hypothetical protein [Odoribacter sp.]